MRTVFPQEVETNLKRAFLGHLDKGYFVEIGAFLPEDGSQTFDLEQQVSSPHERSDMRETCSMLPGYRFTHPSYAVTAR
jgi:hypothetical protein